MLDQLNNLKKYLKKLIEELDEYIPNGTDVDYIRRYYNVIDSVIDLITETEHSMESLRDRLEAAEDDLGGFDDDFDDYDDED